MARFVVTGGAGFIGSSLVRALLSQGSQIRVVDDFSTGSRKNLEGLEDRIELIEGDLADMTVAREALSGIDFVLHQAAIPSVPRSIEDPIASNRANITATLNVLVAARDARVKRLVFASSSSVYGDTETLPKVETMHENPISPYALTKYTGERYCRIFQRLYGLPTVSLRYFNVFGPRQDPTSHYSGVISRFLSAAFSGQRPKVLGDGEQSRDFTFIDNVVSANLLSCQAAGVEGQVFNIGAGERHSLNELLDTLGSILGRALNPEYAPSRAGDVRHSQADIGQARRALGYQPQIGFREGLQRTVEWFRLSCH